MYAVFVDLKAVFDNIDRELWEILENKEIDRSLIIHLKKIYEGTRTAVWTAVKIEYLACSKRKKKSNRGAESTNV